jgi:toxin ParE1/3/4
MAENKLPIIWSPEAIDDIDHLWDHYARVAGRATADKIMREIAKAVAAIDDFPLAGRARDEIRAGLRSLTAPPQVVFYRLKDDRPEIVRVLDGRRDIEEIFSDDEHEQESRQGD